MASFSDFNLHEMIIKTLKSIGFSSATPIQDEAIPRALEGADIMASAQTGTGKTAAFLLPALHALSQENDERFKGPSVLILVPTRELAEQVSQEALRFSKHLPKIKTVCIYGGMPYPQQIKALSKPYHILVATPGRLLDHMMRKKINLSQIKYFVLDEADRMLDMGFIDDVEKIASEMPKSRQTLLFSATLNRNVQKISQSLQNDPVVIKIKPTLLAEGLIDQRLYYVDNLDHKISLLDNLLEDSSIEQAIIFTSTKIQADDLSDALLDKGYSSAALHSDIKQAKRNKVIERMRLGKLKFVVATDVAARGLDVNTLSHVINFDIPRFAEDFVHRIGRTGRAGASGIAITFATYAEKKFLSQINKLTGKPMDVHTVKGMEPKPDTFSLKPSHSAKRASRFMKNRGPSLPFSKNSPKKTANSNRYASFPKRRHNNKVKAS